MHSDVAHCASLPPSRLLGRDALLRLLMNRMQTDHRILLGIDPGLKCRTGVGRSALLGELVSQVSPLFSRVLRLDGAGAVHWRHSLLRVAEELNLRQREFRRKSDLVAAIRGWLNQNDRWLLAIDHVEDLDEISELLEGVKSGQVIAVLRDGVEVNTEKWPAALPLGTLARQDAAALLQAAARYPVADLQDHDPLLTVADRVEGNPLCAILAGRLLSVGAFQLGQLKEALSVDPDASPLITILNLALNWIQSRNPEALTVLAAAVVLGPEPVSLCQLSTLVQGEAGQGQLIADLESLGLMRTDSRQQFCEVPAATELKTLIPSAVQRQAALQLAGAFHKPVKPNRLREIVCGYVVHRVDAGDDPAVSAARIKVAQFLASDKTSGLEFLGLISQGAEATWDHLVPEIGQKLWQNILDRIVAAARPEEELLEPLVELGVALVQGDKQQQARRRWRQVIEFCPVEHPLLTELLLAIAESDVNDNRFDKAEARLNQIAAICRAQSPSDHLSLLEAQLEYLMGGVDIGLGRNAQARLRFQRSIELRTPLLSADHPQLMKSRLMLARVEFLLKNFAACEQLLEAEVRIRQDSPRVSDTELGVALNFLAEQYYLSGRLSQAEPVYERAIDVRRRTFPRGHRLIGEMANRLAVIKSARGGYRDSDPLFREALSCLEETYGPEHPEVSRALNDLAESLFSQNKLEPARRLLERALHIQERSLRGNDARISRTRSNLAAVYVARGRHAEAVRLYEKDISLRQSQSLPDRASLATSLNNLAEALRSLGRFHDAELRLLEALKIREQLVGSQHPQVAQILGNLGYLYLHQHRYDEAITLLTKALGIRESCLSPNHPQIAITLGTLAEVEFSARRHLEARGHFFRAIEIAQTTHGDRHPQVLGLQVASARNEFRLGHLGRAELMLNRAKAVIDETLGPDHRISARCMLGMAELAQNEKRYDAAFPLLERSLVIVQSTTSGARLELAETLRLIAENLAERKLPAEALVRVEQLLEIQQEILPPGHGEMIPTWTLLGQLKQALKDPAGAAAAFRAVIESNAAQNVETPRDIFARLADVLIEQGQFDESLELLDRLAREAVTRGDANERLRLLSQSAGVYYLQSRYEQAADVMEQCLLLSEEIHGPDSPETARHLDNLAGARFLLGQMDAAEPAIQRAIRILEQEVPPRPAALNKARENYSQLLRSTGRTVEADQLDGQVELARAERESPSLTGSHVLDDL